MMAYNKSVEKLTLNRNKNKGDDIMSSTNRIGERFMTNEGYEIVIIEYNNARNVTIQFQDEYKDKIPKELYEAMYRWVVEIDD